VSAYAKSRSGPGGPPSRGEPPQGELGPLFDALRDAQRSPAIDCLLHTVADREWGPDDPEVMDLSQPFDVRRQAIMPEEWFPELRSAVGRDLTVAERIALGNEIIRWFLSGILHGEQAAFYISAQLCLRLEDAAAREFMANQAREEARHARAFSRYIARRWGAAYSPGEAFGRLLRDLHDTDRIDYKIVGMSGLIEGFAMGALSNIRAHTLDPALDRMLGHVLRDETVHHNFGTIWLEETRGRYSGLDWQELRHFAHRAYLALRLNLVSIYQRREIYAPLGLDWRRVRLAIRESRGRREKAPGLEEGINPLTVLARNLVRMGLMPTTQARPQHGSSPVLVEAVDS